MPSLVLLLLGALIVAIGGVGIVLILALTFTWRRQQRRLREHRPSRVHHLDAWQMAGLRYQDPGDDPSDPDNPFGEPGDADEGPGPGPNPPEDGPPGGGDEPDADSGDTVDTDDEPPDAPGGTNQPR
jgi:hypothetical protein